MTAVRGIACALLAAGLLHVGGAVAEDSPHCKQLLAESQRLASEAFAALHSGPDAGKLPRSQEITKRIEQLQRESRKDGESLDTRNPQAIEAFHKRDSARHAEMQKLGEENQKIQAPVVSQALARAEPAAQRSKQAYATFEQECRQRERKDAADQKAMCAKHNQVLRDYGPRIEQLRVQAENKRKPYDAAQTQLDAYRKTTYKTAFEAVDTAYSSGRQPTPDQVSALSKAEQQLKQLQQDADTRKKRSEQDTAPLLAQIEKEHQAQTDYGSRMPPACVQGGP
jgi:hypothetical protein